MVSKQICFFNKANIISFPELPFTPVYDAYLFINILNKITDYTFVSSFQKYMANSTFPDHHIVLPPILGVLYRQYKVNKDSSFISSDQNTGTVKVCIFIFQTEKY